MAEGYSSQQEQGQLYPILAEMVRFESLLWRRRKTMHRCLLQLQELFWWSFFEPPW